MNKNYKAALDEEAEDYKKSLVPQDGYMTQRCFKAGADFAFNYQQAKIVELEAKYDGLEIVKKLTELETQNINLKEVILATNNERTQLLQAKIDKLVEALLKVATIAALNKQPHAMFEGDGYVHIEARSLSALAQHEKDGK